MEVINEQLHERSLEAMDTNELIGARLYTGPMYAKVRVLGDHPTRTRP